MATLDTEWTLGLWEKAVEMYEESNKVGIPLHMRDVPTRDAWRNAAKRSLGRAAR